MFRTVNDAQGSRFIFFKVDRPFKNSIDSKTNVFTIQRMISINYEPTKTKRDLIFVFLYASSALPALIFRCLVHDLIYILIAE